MTEFDDVFGVFGVMRRHAGCSKSSARNYRKVDFFDHFDNWRDMYSATKAPQDERVEFFKFKYAWSAFAECRRILDYISREGIENGHTLHHPLWTAFVVNYGKPFKQRQPLRLDPVIVPEEFHDVHGNLLIFRDKMYAHTDLDLLHERTRETLNSLVVFTGENGVVRFGNGFIYPTADMAVRYRELLNVLLKKTDYHAAKRWKAWKVKVKRNARYIVNVTDASDDVLLPIAWEGRDDAA